jgi:hypothetical protein
MPPKQRTFSLLLCSLLSTLTLEFLILALADIRCVDGANPRRDYGAKKLEISMIRSVVPAA